MTEQCPDCFYYENRVIDLHRELKEAKAKIEKADMLYARALDIVEPTKDPRENPRELFYNLSKAVYHYEETK